MVKYKEIIFSLLILFFLFFSFYPTVFELSRSNSLADYNREFILEHNYYFPDFNLYLSKIRQGWEGRFTALERYTSERHTGSIIQEFYVVLGLMGKVFNIDPNFSYQLGRIILSPLLLIIVLLFIRYYFKSFAWQIIGFLTVLVSGSFPRFFTDSSGITHIGRFMEWWSNIDALQRITFIPHILFGQVVSFYLLYYLTLNIKHKTYNKFLLYIILGNIVGLVFPPSLITLDAVFILMLIINLVKRFIRNGWISRSNIKFSKVAYGMSVPNIISVLSHKTLLPNQHNNADMEYRFFANEKILYASKISILFIILTLPSLLYLLLITKHLPWSALVIFHRTHPMMIPFDQYILGTGPVIFLGLFGAIISIIRKDTRLRPLIFWVIATFLFASFFSVVKEQSPLRFTQTGLFIPLGILAAYLFRQLYQIRPIRLISLIGITIYLLLNLFMMGVSLTWQTTWISQLIGASIPAVPYPPQTMLPLKSWMDGIRWLRSNTDHDDVVLAGITAGNYIPAYSGNTVYFGQANTVDYEKKQLLVEKFFQGEMKEKETQLFLTNGRVKYIFFSVQEKELSKGKNLEAFYPFIKTAYSNNLVTIYSIFSYWTSPK